MSKSEKTFVEKCLAGEALLDDMNDYIASPIGTAERFVDPEGS